MSGGMAQAMIMYDLSGPELKQLEKYSDSIQAAMKKIPGAVDVSSNLVTGKPEVAVQIDRERAADLGVSVADVASALQLLVGGHEGVDLRGGRAAVRGARPGRARSSGPTPTA